MRFETTARANVKRGVYRLADAATNAFQRRARQVAAYLGAADADEVVFTSGTTLAINIAAHALAPPAAARRRDPGLGARASQQHRALAARGRARRRQGPRHPGHRGGPARTRPAGRGGTARTRIIAVTHASNVTGAVTDVAACARPPTRWAPCWCSTAPSARRTGPLDVQALGCDLYAFSAHKMFGPTGAGALWLRGELLAELPPFLGGGEMIRRVEIERTTYAPPPHRFEAGTPAIGAALGMGAAAAWLARWTGRRWAGRSSADRAAARRARRAAAACGCSGPRGTQARLGVVSFTVDGVHAHDVCQMLDGHGVACAAAITAPSR